MISRKNKVNSFGVVLESHSKMDSLSYCFNELDCLVVDPFLSYGKTGKGRRDSTRKADLFFIKREEKLDSFSMQLGENEKLPD
jgi:hypothetical protein